MSFLSFSTSEEFYPEGLCFFHFPCSSPWTIKLALKFKDFPVPTAIFKDFQRLEFLF